MKELGRFLVSGVFMAHLLLASFVFFLCCLGVWEWLKISTNHGKHVEVPQLENLTILEADSILASKNLSLKVIDTAAYFNPKVPMSGVIRQQPIAGSQVKEGRTIYIQLNRHGFRKVPVPKIIQVTTRTARLQLEAVGFEIEKVTKIRRIGEDMVYEIRQDGQSILPGVELPRTTSLELVVGSGTR